ncbi:MAG: asparagine synthase (glutamine-hydrolyzing) [Chlorobi bacterium]|nr:asparagine synthase (glutamine-hydrolyzing) [Chlorobiota bacterium]
MCGIAGIIDWRGNVSQQELERLASSLSHRGVDDEGYYLNSDRKVGFAHRRLAILDPTPRGRQPFIYSNRYVIVYNGEIYNFVELREFLRRKGYVFTTGTDTEVLLACYDYWKTDCLHHLDGMFAFAIYDTQQNRIFFARDRFGEKPLYFYFLDDRIVFASEIKAFRSLDLPLTATTRRILEYLYFSVMESPTNNTETFFKEVVQLPPAHFLTIDLNTTFSYTPKRYWQLSTDTIGIPYSQAVETVKELLTESIGRRLRSDVPIGTSLSGGLDSSTIVSFLARVLRVDLSNFKGFSAVFPNFENNEEKYVDQLSEDTGISTIKVKVDKESAYQHFERVVWAQEEPFGTGSIIAQYLVFKEARRHKTIVLLDGQGSDELFAGYVHFWETYLRELLSKKPIEFFREIKAFMNNPTFKRRGSLLRILITAMLGTKTNQLRRFLASHLNNTSFTKGINPELLREYIQSIEFPMYYGRNLKEHLLFSITKHGLLDLLHYADRNSMSHSVEVRLPFLYHKLVEFALSLPSDCLIKNGLSKRILRDAVKGIVPEQIRTRKDKVGFEVPQQKWLSHPSFKERLRKAIATLKTKKLITEPHPALFWQYIVLDSVMESIDWKME